MSATLHIELDHAVVLAATFITIGFGIGVITVLAMLNRRNGQ